VAALHVASKVTRYRATAAGEAMAEGDGTAVGATGELPPPQAVSPAAKRTGKIGIRVMTPLAPLPARTAAGERIFLDHLGNAAGGPGGLPERGA
jgi:hypothetical protein